MRRRRAFTLFELILVMAIMLIISAMAMPMIYEAMYSDTRVSAAADMVRARWADCRSQAMEEGRSYQFSVIPNSGMFKVELYQPNGGEPNAGGLMIQDSLPKGVRFGTADHPVDATAEEVTSGEYVPIAVFQADGSAMEDVDVIFGAAGAMQITLRLQAFSGAATTIHSGREAGK